MGRFGAGLIRIGGFEGGARRWGEIGGVFGRTSGYVTGEIGACRLGFKIDLGTVGPLF